MGEGVFVMVLGSCAVCGQIFSFSPSKVPSIRINRKREPICRICIEMVNRVRAAGGVEPFLVLEGTYEEESAMEPASSLPDGWVQTRCGPGRLFSVCDEIVTVEMDWTYLVEFPVVKDESTTNQEAN